MKKLLIGVLLCAFVPFSYAQSSGLPTSSVLQLFSCNLNPGQNLDDVWSLLESVRGTITEPTAGTSIFLWVPFRGATGYDYIWGATDASLISMMDNMSNFASSGSGQLLGPRFQSVNERCDSVVALNQQIKAGSMSTKVDRMPDAMVETFSCKLKPGATMDDATKAAEFWKEQVAKVASESLQKYEAYMVTPYRGGTGEADFGWIGNYPDMGTYGRGETDYMNSNEGKAAEARFAKVSTCRSALWTGYWVMAPRT